MTDDTTTVLARWARAVEDELDLPADSVDITEILDLARDAAHHVARPAAPVTTYLVGYARGLAAAREATDGATHRAADAAATTSRLALGWDPS